MDHSNDLVDRIYEAAFTPELWQDVLGDIARVVGSASGSLLIYEDERPVRFAATESTRELVRGFCESGWKQNSRARFNRSNPLFAFTRADDYFAPEGADAESGLEPWRAAGFGDQIGTMIPMPSGETTVFAFDRWASDGPFERPAREWLNDHYPHLARSSLMAARLRLEQAQATTSALQAIGLPAAVLSSGGRLRATNSLFDKSAALFRICAFDAVELTDAAAGPLFSQALANSGAWEAPIVRSVPVKPSGELPASVVHVVPLLRSARDIFAQADVLVAVTTVGTSKLVPSPTILLGLFDLAPAEARVALALTRGLSLKAFAEESGLSFNSVRKYLDRVYAKTGTHHQSELVSLLKGMHTIE